MFLNINNLSVFEGRITKDIVVENVQAGGKTFTKVKFKIAIDKGYTKEKKAQEKAAGKPTAEFVPIEATGPKADFISRFFSKGSAIKIVAVYRAYDYKDKITGLKAYGHCFDVVDAGFCLGGSKDDNGNNNDYNNNYSPQGQGAGNTIAMPADQAPFDYGSLL